MSDVAVRETPDYKPSRPRPWRQSLGILRKEFAVVTGRHRFVVLQSLFVAYLSVVLIFNLPSSDDWSMRISSFLEAAPRLVGTLCLYAYIGLLFLAPALAVNVLRDERSSGMLEVIRCAPMSTQRLFLSLVGSRLILVLQFMTAAVPLFALPILFGGTQTLAVMSAALACMAIGASVATLYALRLSSYDLNSFGIYRRLVAFLACPLSVLGLPVIGLALPMMFVGAALPRGPDIMFGVAFPFVGLGFICAGRSLLDPFACASLATSTVALMVVAWRIPGVLGTWVAFEPKSLGRRHAPKDASNTLTQRLSKLTRVLQQGAKPEGVTHTSSGRKRAPLLSMQRLSNLRGLSQKIYAYSARNPLYVLFLLESDSRSGRGLGFMVFVICAVTTLLFSSHLWVSASAQSSFGARGLLLALATCVPIVVAIARVIPRRQRGQFTDVTLAAPLTARTLQLGVLAIVIQLSVPFLAVVFLLGIADMIHHPLPLAFGFVSMYCVHVWAYASIALCVCTIVRSFGARLGVSALLVSLLTFPALLPLFGGRVGWVRLHPTFVWVTGAASLDQIKLLLGMILGLVLLLGLHTPLFNMARQRA